MLKYGIKIWCLKVWANFRNEWEWMEMNEDVWDFSKLCGMTGSIFASFFQYDEMNEIIEI